MRLFWIMALLCGVTVESVRAATPVERDATAQPPGDFVTYAMRCIDRELDTDRRIAACTWLLQSGKLSREGYANVFVSRGNAYQNKGENARAIKDFDQALAHDADDVSVYISRGVAHYLAGHYDQAVDDQTMAIRRAPNAAGPYAARGIAHYGGGRPELAIADLTRAITLRPGNATHHYSRGLAHEKIGALDKALQDYGKAVLWNPDHAGAHRASADILATAPDAGLRNGAEAVRQAERALTLADTAEARTTLAAAYAEAGRFEDATRLQQSAIARLGKDEADMTAYRQRLSLYRAGKPYRRR